MIKFLKDHIENKEGDKVELDPSLENYLIRVGVAEQVELKEDKKEK